MKILVSNDDGWQSAGITSLYHAMCEIAEVKLVAPDRNCSAASSSLTLMNPIRATEHRADVYGLQGTPADCVNIALNGLFNWKPDLVVSGINEGANLGDDVIYSGTLAAAIEGVLHGVPGIAFSLAGYSADYECAARVAKKIVGDFIKRGLDASSLINVNIPPVPYDEIQGYAVTRLGTRKRGHNPIVEKDPRGNDIYWIGPAGDPFDESTGTDFHAINERQVSLTPITTDLTDLTQLDRLSALLGTAA